MQNTDEIWRLVEAKQDAFIELSDRIWEMPELNFQETRSAHEHAEMLRAQGFRVTEAVGGIPTAVMGEAGEGGPVIAILGEYDALPGLSQEAGVAEHRPLQQNGAGHGCGHNLLGAGAMLAATAVKDWLAAHGIEGRVRYYGCPAEEGGAAKTFMVRDGVFDDVDIAISWHPAPFAGVNEAHSLAILQVDYAFTGAASHAAVSPELGRSALDAAELMNVGVNYLREHMPSSARIHYAYLDAGGIAPNVVQASAKLRYLIRAAELPELQALAARVDRIAEGAALMTETTHGAQRGQRDEQPARQRAARADHVRQSAAARAAAVRRRGPGVRRRDPQDGGRRRISTRRTSGSASRSPMRRCATLSCRSRRGARGWWARPMWAMSAGRCRRCRCAARPTRSARRAIPGSSPRRARARWRIRGWCTRRR